MTARIGESSGENNVEMVDYMFNNPPPQQLSSSFCTSTSVDRMSFADVMQLAEFGPKSALNQAKISDEENGIDPVYFLKFPVLNDKYQDEGFTVGPQMRHEEKFDGVGLVQEEDEEEARVSEKTAARLRLLGETLQKNTNSEVKNRRKRPRSMKTSEEVESQRMTHIAVERNRRKQMNEHLRVLRSLMPGSYVQRGDQASIIGGAIEFVRELEQLLQCLESQKRRKLYGGSSDIVSRPLSESPSQAISQPQPPVFPPFLLPNDQIKLVDLETDLREETAENKSCLADVEVRLLGFDAMIKILSRRRPGQLLKTIAALEDLQLNILHTNITTIDQTVLYSFNVKMASDSRFTAEDIVSSVQQIYSFIHAGNTISSA
ncbi:hypothetical protein GIB67_018735 [Kingdonia uniflora]|uniref:Transcription factor FAMA n=1 Tax=Kingdonia uniflora TaxID=39325 RepID=A0A7J7LSS0_9MAGN|nr:hypothetical protein GIB67_018735 [Kingdonia uniflora]